VLANNDERDAVAVDVASLVRFGPRFSTIVLALVGFDFVGDIKKAAHLVWILLHTGSNKRKDKAIIVRNILVFVSTALEGFFRCFVFRLWSEHNSFLSDCSELVVVVSNNDYSSVV
jgi:hypothetical protein